VRAKGGHFKQLLWQYSAIWQETFLFLSNVTRFWDCFFLEITTISYFWLSQGSAATYWRYGGKYYMDFVGNILGYQQWKNFENPLRIDKVIAMSTVYYIFGTQCIYSLCCCCFDFCCCLAERDLQLYVQCLNLESNCLRSTELNKCSYTFSRHYVKTLRLLLRSLFRMSICLSVTRVYLWLPPPTCRGALSEYAALAMPRLAHIPRVGPHGRGHQISIIYRSTGSLG